MKQNLKNAAPALGAVLILVITGIVNLREAVPSGRYANFEIMSNFLLLTVAVAAFFLQGLPSIKGNYCDLSIILSNIAVSAMAFPMNINIFKHTVHLESLGKDLWGWHTGWLLFVLIQILFLTEIGNKLYKQMELIFGGIGHLSQRLGTGLGNAGKKLGISLGIISEKLENLCSDIIDEARKINKRNVIIIFTGVFLWGIYFGVLCYRSDISIIFSDMKFWRNSLLLWIYYFIMIFMLHIIIPVLQKLKDSVLQLKSKLILIVVLSIVFIILVSSMLPESLAIIFILAVAVSLLVVAIKKTRRMKPNESLPENNGNQAVKKMERINLKYILILITSFVVIPLTFLFLITVLRTEISNAVVSNSNNIISTILNFYNAVSETAEDLLEEFL